MAARPFERTATSEIAPLQMMRGLAAGLVVFSHLLRLEHEAWTSSREMFLPALPFGNIGVYAFFVISGFIMHRTAGDEFGAPGAWSRFLGRRVARIAPLYWLLTAAALICPFCFGAHRTTLLGVALSFAFQPDVTWPGLNPALEVGWTLSFEMLFYVVFATCLGMRRGFGVTLLLLVFPVFLDVTHLLGATALATTPWWAIVQWWAKPELLLFGLGVLLSMTETRYGRLVDRSGLGVPAALAMIVLAPAATFVLHIPEQKLAESLIAAAAVAICVLTTEPGAANRNALVRLGDVSYSLYLSHAFVIGGLSAAWLALVGPHASVAFDLAALGAACLVAWPLHRFVEKPLTRSARVVLERAPTVKPQPQRAPS
jgi:peptidoglycan/LPS O-acetylase OafA/YrhL